MKTFSLSRLVICLAVVTSAKAQSLPGTPHLPNFDKRKDRAISAPGQPDAKTAGAAALQVRIPTARVAFDEIVGSPKLIDATDGFLSGPDGQGRGISSASAAAFPANDPHRATKAFLKEHRALFGHGPEVLAAARVKRESVTAHNGLRTVVWEQQLDGIPVFEAVLISHTTWKGELVNISSQFLPELDQAANAGTPNRAALVAQPIISAKQAVFFTARNVEADLGEASITAVDDPSTDADKHQRFRAPPHLSGEVEVHLVWLPMSSSVMRLCWEVVLTSHARSEMFRVLVDVRNGEALFRQCLTSYLSDATYRVFVSDSPSPFSPGWPIPNTNQPPLVARQLLTFSALNTNASPNGWINDGINETRGNNVDAHTDKNGDNLPDLPRPQGSPFRVFDFPMDLAQAPSTYTNAAVAQLFYWCNWYHDKLYELGFTEAAGNFQGTNFGRGGLGNPGLYQFNDANATNYPRRFYQLRSP